jgi:putative intracellular protease/amidase
LQGEKVAIIATDGVEEAELVKPREATAQAGARTELLWQVARPPGGGRPSAWQALGGR